MQRAISPGNHWGYSPFSLDKQKHIDNYLYNIYNSDIDKSLYDKTMVEINN